MAFLLSAFRTFRYDLFYRLVSRPHAGLTSMGEIEPRSILREGLDAESVVVSAGVGHDISFERALADTVGCRVLLLDPSPTGRRTAGLPENQSPLITFLPMGLAATRGDVRFSPPVDAHEGSYTLERGDGETCAFSCTTLRDLLDEHGHERIALLKLDIEGFEYEVLDHVLAEEIPVDQICVEFHHWAGAGRSRWDTIRLTLRLLRHGYRLVHRDGWDQTFVHARCASSI